MTTLKDALITYVHRHKNSELSVKFKIKAEDYDDNVRNYLENLWQEGGAVEIIIKDFQNEEAEA